MTTHLVLHFVGRAPKTKCGIYVPNKDATANYDLVDCKKCRPPAEEHRAHYTRRALGGSPIRGGGIYYGYTIRCGCGWEMRVNEPKREAIKWFNDHKREARRARQKG